MMSKPIYSIPLFVSIFNDPLIMINFITDRCHRNVFVLTPLRQDNDLGDLTSALLKSAIIIADKLTPAGLILHLSLLVL